MDIDDDLSCLELPPLAYIRAPTKKLAELNELFPNPDPEPSSKRFKTINPHVLSDSDKSDDESGNVASFSGSQPLSRLLEDDNLPSTSGKVLSSSQPLPTTKKKGKDNTQKKLARELKHKEKTEKAAMRADLKKLKPKECTKYVTTVIGTGIMNYSWGQNTIEELQEDPDFKLRLDEIVIDECCITWERQLGSESENEVTDNLLCWPYERVLQLMTEKSFINHFIGFQSAFPSYKIYLSIYGLSDYLKGPSKPSKKSQNMGPAERRLRRKGSNISKDEFQMELVELQLRTGISVLDVKNVSELVNLIKQHTKIIAEIPYRQMKESLEQDLRCHASKGLVKSVRVDQDGNGLSRLWHQMLCQLNLTSLDTAKAIAQVFPSPFLLMEAYNSTNSEREKQLLLQDISISKRQGAAGKQRIGPVLSKKIYTLFNSDNENEIL